MSKKNTIDYDALATRLIDPAQPTTGSDTVGGDAAAEIGREFLIREYGTAEAIERAMVTPGRPRVGQRGGASPTVRARITREEYGAMKQLEATTGRSQSDLVREAVHRFLREHKLVG